MDYAHEWTDKRIERLKVNGAWARVSKAYRKVNGVWTEYAVDQVLVSGTEYRWEAS